MPKFYLSSFLIVVALGSCARNHSEPDWYRYMENARAACKDSDFVHSDEWLAKAKSEAKQHDMNPPKYNAAPSTAPNSMPGELVTLADMYRRRERYEKAQELCDLAILISDKPEYQCLLAEIYDGEGKHKEAEEILLKVLEQGEKTGASENKQKYWQAVFVPMRTLANHYVQEEKLAKAEDLDTKALNLTEEVYPNADISEQLATVGKLSLRLGKTEKAQKLFEKFMTVKSNNAREVCEVSGLLADIYVGLGKDKEAEALYKKALQEPVGYGLSPSIEEVTCRHNYANLLKKLNQPDESKKIEVSARNMEALLNSKAIQNNEEWKTPTIYQ